MVITDLEGHLEICRSNVERNDAPATTVTAGNFLSHVCRQELKHTAMPTITVRALIPVPRAPPIQYESRMKILPQAGYSGKTG